MDFCLLSLPAIVRNLVCTPFQEGAVRSYWNSGTF